MQIIFTYEDIRLWLKNYLDLDMQVEAFSADSGEFAVTIPAIGMRRLLPDDYRFYKQIFQIEEYDASSVTINISGPYEKNALFHKLLVRYVNHYHGADVIEPLPRGRIKLHLDRIDMPRTIELHTLVLSAQGVEIGFAEDSELYEQLRMLQLLLRAGYSQVSLLPEDMDCMGYWFSDDTLDYTLLMADHPADIRIQTSIQIMDWLGLGRGYGENCCPAVYPKTKIDYKYGRIHISTPLTIAESEINALTIERNCKRLKDEVKGVIATILDNLCH